MNLDLLMLLLLPAAGAVETGKKILWHSRAGGLSKLV